MKKEERREEEELYNCKLLCSLMTKIYSINSLNNNLNIYIYIYII